MCSIEFQHEGIGNAVFCSVHSSSLLCSGLVCLSIEEVPCDAHELPPWGATRCCPALHRDERERDGPARREPRAKAHKTEQLTASNPLKYQRYPQCRLFHILCLFGPDTRTVFPPCPRGDPCWSLRYSGVGEDGKSSASAFSITNHHAQAGDCSLTAALVLVYST